MGGGGVKSIMISAKVLAWEQAPFCGGFNPLTFAVANCPDKAAPKGSNTDWSSAKVTVIFVSVVPASKWTSCVAVGSAKRGISKTISKAYLLAPDRTSQEQKTVSALKSIEHTRLVGGSTRQAVFPFPPAIANEPTIKTSTIVKHIKIVFFNFCLLTFFLICLK